MLASGLQAGRDRSVPHRFVEAAEGRVEVTRRPRYVPIRHSRSSRRTRTSSWRARKRAKEHVVTAKQAQAFDVYERRSIEIAPHDRLLLTANRQEPDFHATNGEIVRVSQVDDHGRLHLEDGRRIP